MTEKTKGMLWGAGVTFVLLNVGYCAQEVQKESLLEELREPQREQQEWDCHGLWMEDLEESPKWYDLSCNRICEETERDGSLHLSCDERAAIEEDAEAELATGSSLLEQLWDEVKAEVASATSETEQLRETMEQMRAGGRELNELQRALLAQKYMRAAIRECMESLGIDTSDEQMAAIVAQSYRDEIRACFDEKTGKMDN